MNKQRLLKNLGESIICVRFIKKNGDERLLKCTRNLQLVDDAHIPKNQNHDDESNVIRAYDVDAKGWRSFDFDSIIEIIK